MQQVTLIRRHHLNSTGVLLHNPCYRRRSFGGGLRVGPEFDEKCTENRDSSITKVTLTFQGDTGEFSGQGMSSDAVGRSRVAPGRSGVAPV